MAPGGMQAACILRTAGKVSGFYITFCPCLRLLCHRSAMADPEFRAGIRGGVSGRPALRRAAVRRGFGLPGRRAASRVRAGRSGFKVKPLRRAGGLSLCLQAVATAGGMDRLRECVRTSHKPARAAMQHERAECVLVRLTSAVLCWKMAGRGDVTGYVIVKRWPEPRFRRRESNIRRSRNIRRVPFRMFDERTRRYKASSKWPRTQRREGCQKETDGGYEGRRAVAESAGRAGRWEDSSTGFWRQAGLV
ncbi:hypothetical protein C8Q77DRAFT_1115732 [Trametes polyzona]|nr:hypothetical protein C8Q77DRAFT_1115732 [Trametes polyzona]